MPYVSNPEDGVQINYENTGNGPPLLLLHGFMQDLEFWRIAGYVDALAPHYQLILVDDRGHGRSGKPHDPAAYVMDRRVGDLLAVMDDLGIDQAHFWGFSLGGYIGFGMLELAPERLRSAIIGGSHPYPLDPVVINRNIDALKPGMHAYIASVESNIGRLPEPYRERRLAQDHQALIASLIARRDLMPAYGNTLAKLNVPVLLYAGTLDAIHDQVKEVSQASPVIEFASIGDVDHGATFMRSDLVLHSVSTFLEQAESHRRYG